MWGCALTARDALTIASTLTVTLGHACHGVMLDSVLRVCRSAHIAWALLRSRKPLVREDLRHRRCKRHCLIEQQYVQPLLAQVRGASENEPRQTATQTSNLTRLLLAAGLSMLVHETMAGANGGRLADLGFVGPARRTRSSPAPRMGQLRRPHASRRMPKQRAI